MVKVTCSILCHNYGRYLSAAIDSCLYQEKGDYELEVIVIDDGSTDNTPEVYSQYVDSIKYYRSENEGFAASLTKAVKYATGEIICLLDADDYFLPGKINTALKLFTAQENLLFLYHDKALIDENNHVIKHYDSGGNTSTQVFKKSAALDLLPAYNEQFFITLHMAGKGVHLKKKLSCYRVHNSSMSKPEALITWKNELIKMNILHLKKIRQLINNPTAWANKNTLQKIYAEVASGYNYLKMEVSLNRQSKLYALKYYILILKWDLKADKIRLKNVKYIITYFLLNRYIKY